MVRPSYDSTIDPGQEAPRDPFQGVSVNRLEAAFQYVEHGLAIFPCQPGTKQPATPHGFLDASNELRPYDHPRLSGYAQFFPPDGSELLVNAKENWAIEPGLAGYTVIDIDPKNGGDETWAELEARHGRVITREVHTPSGGRHLWFLGTLPQVNRRLGIGIDTRCSGGYVLLPPSRVQGRTYTWLDDTIPIAPLPAWIIEEIEAASEREAEIRDELRSGTYSGEGGDAFESRLALIGDHEGGLGFYDPMLRAVGAGVALGMAADAILDRLRETAETADRHNHTLADVKDRLSKMPDAIRAFQAKDAQRRREAEEMAEEVAEAEAEGTYEVDPEFEEAFAAQQAGGSGKWTDGTADAAEAGPGAAEAAGSAEQAAGPDKTDQETGEGSFEASTGWISAAEASATLTARVEAFFKNPEPQLLALPVTAGLGKTEAAINAALNYTTGWRPEDARTPYDPNVPIDLQELLNQDLSRIPAEELQVAYAVPRHSLGEEIRSKAEMKLWSALTFDRFPVRRGRNQGGCRRAKEAAALASKGYPVYGNLCDSAKGRCPFFSGCPYLAQSREAAGAPMGIVTHAHLGTDRWEPTNDDFYWNLANADVHIIDEAALSAFLDKATLTQTDVKELSELFYVDIRAELEGRNELLTALADAGWTAEKLGTIALAREKRESLTGYVLNPADADEEQIAELKNHRRLAPAIPKLADELASGRGGMSYSLILRDGAIITQGRKRIPITKGLFLDATFPEEIMRAFFPTLEVAPALRVRRNAHVTQVIDRTFSRSQLLKKGVGTEQLAQVARFIALKDHELKAQGRKLVVGADKRVRAHLTGESAEELKRVFGPALGSDIAHFANVRGSNAFEEHAALISLGRDQPRGEDIEDFTMAVFYDTAEPIKFAKRDAKGHVLYSETTRNYQMRDGSRVESKPFACLPDRRCQAVLELAREAGIIQMIDRLRLLHNPEPKDVFILSNIPLDIEVDRLVSWEELAGNHRLNKLLDTCPTEGLEAAPLTPSWLVERKLFRNPKSAENWLRYSQVIDFARKSNNPENAIRSIVMGNSGLCGAQASTASWEPKVVTWRLVEYRLAGHSGRWSNALVCGSDDRVAIAAALGVPASAVELKFGSSTAQKASGEPPPPEPEPTSRADPRLKPTLQSNIILTTS